MIRAVISIACLFLTLSSSAKTLSCFVKDEARENAGLPLHRIMTNLATQNTTLIKRTLNDANEIVELKPTALIGNIYVSTLAPTERTACEMKKQFVSETQRGYFQFFCPVVHVSVAYDLKNLVGSFSEGFGASSRMLPFKDCTVNP